MTIQSFSSNHYINTKSSVTTSTDAENVKPVPPASAVELMHKEKFELSMSEEALVKMLERINKALSGTRAMQSSAFISRMAI